MELVERKIASHRKVAVAANSSLFASPILRDNALFSTLVVAELLKVSLSYTLLQEVGNE